MGEKLGILRSRPSGAVRISMLSMLWKLRRISVCHSGRLSQMAVPITSSEPLLSEPLRSPPCSLRALSSLRPACGGTSAWIGPIAAPADVCPESFRCCSLCACGEELLPAMGALLERVGEIDRRVEGNQLGAGQPEAGEPVAPRRPGRAGFGRPLRWVCGSRGWEAVKPRRSAGSPQRFPAARAPSR